MDDPEYPADGWFNIFTLHQNRVVHTQSAKNCVKDTYLPNFLDYVLWGHEHECIPEPVVRHRPIPLPQEWGSIYSLCLIGPRDKCWIPLLRKRSW